MAKWNVARGGPEWLMDSEGRVYGYKDKRGREFAIPQAQGSVGDAEGNGPTDTSLKILSGVSGDGNRVRAVAEARGGSRLQAGKAWLRLPASVTGLTASGGATLAATTRHGRPSIEITSPGNASVQGFYFALPASGTVGVNQHVVFEVEDASEWVGGNWRLGFFDGAAGVLSNGVQCVQTVDRHSGWTGVHCLAPLNVATTTSGGSTTEWANVGSGSFATTMTQGAFRCVRKSGASNTTRIWVYEIAESEKNSLPQIVFGGDDGALSWYESGLPILEKYGFSSYLAFIADERGTATRMSQAQWADAIARGHHAVVHGCRQINGVTVASLTDYLTDYATYGFASAYEAILTDITYHRDIMVREGLDPDGLGRTVYVLPQGYHQRLSEAGNMTVENALRAAGMVGGRRALIQNAIIANGGWSDSALYLPIIGHNWANANEATNITNLVSQMQTEVAAGRSVVFMSHEVRDTPTAVGHITPANLETLVAAAATLVRSGAARAGRLTDLVYELRSYRGPVHIGA